MDFLNRTTLVLRPAASGCDDQGLTERMGMPRGASARLERNACARTRAGAFAWNKGSMRTVPINQSAGPLLDGCEPTLLISMVICGVWIK